LEGRSDSLALTPFDAERDVARYRWVILAVGMAAQAVFAAVLWGVPVLLPAIRVRYGLSLGQVGVVLAAVSYGMVFAVLGWGWVVDRLGERPVIVMGLAGSGLALLAAALAPSFAILVAALAFSGSFGSSVIPASGRAVMGWFPAEKRGLALGIRQTGVPIGAASSALALPALLHGTGLAGAFAALAGLCALALGATAMWLRRPDDGRRSSEERSPAAASTRPLRDARVWRITLTGTLLFPAQACMLGYTVVFLHQERGLSTAHGGAILAGIQVLGAALRITAGRWSDSVGSRIGPLRLLSLAIAIGLAAVALSVDAPITVLVPMLVVAGGLSISWNGLVYTATAEVAGRGSSGVAIGLQQTGLAIAGTVAPLAIAAIVDASSWSVGFGAVALCSLMALTLLRGAIRRV